MNLGKYKFLEDHENCKYNGKLMKCSQIINSQEKEWVWCNGRKWEMELRNGKEFWFLTFCEFNKK